MYIRAQTLIVGHLNTTLSTTDRPSLVKTNKVTSEVLYTLDQLDILNIYKVFHQAIRLYTFFSAAHETFSKIGHILGLKVILKKFKKTEITLHCIRSQQNITRPQQQQKTHRKYANTWRLNDTLLKDQWLTKELGKK
jgi:hypothetical protein